MQQQGFPQQADEQFADTQRKPAPEKIRLVPYNPQCPCADCTAYYHHYDLNAPHAVGTEWPASYDTASGPYQQYDPSTGEWDAPERPRQVVVPFGHSRPVERREPEQPAPQAPQPVPAAAPAPTVMCCYHKQGKCKMGADCWYSHDGDVSTACHYGAGCKAGHRHLVKNGAGALSPSGRVSRAQPMSKVRSAAMQMASVPCVFCGGTDCLRTEKYPVKVDHQVVMGTRAHCLRCLRTYAM